MNQSDELLLILCFQDSFVRIWVTVLSTIRKVSYETYQRTNRKCKKFFA